MKLTSIVFASLVTLLTLPSFAADTAPQHHQRQSSDGCKPAPTQPWRGLALPGAGRRLHGQAALACALPPRPGEPLAARAGARGGAQRGGPWHARAGTMMKKRLAIRGDLLDFTAEPAWGETESGAVRFRPMLLTAMMTLVRMLRGLIAE